MCWFWIRKNSFMLFEGESMKNIYSMDFSYTGMDNSLINEFGDYCKRNKKKIHVSENACVEYYKKMFESDEIARIIVTNEVAEFFEYKGFFDSYTPGNSEKTLNINCTPSVKTYLFYAFKLAILEGEKRFEKTIYKDFSNISFFYRAGEMNYFFFIERIDELFEREFVEYRDLFNKNIVDYCRNNINNGKFVDIHLDDFYIRGKDNFNYKHFVHQNLLYGYDDKKEVFYCLGYDKKIGVSTFEISYPEIINSFVKGMFFCFSGADYLYDLYPWPVTTYKTKSIADTEFDLEDFKKSIIEFINPRPAISKDNTYEVFGFDVYKIISEDILNDNNYTDLRTFQLLEEHKKCVLNRIKYLSLNNSEELINEKTYENMVYKNFKMLKHYYLSFLIKENSNDYKIRYMKNRIKIKNKLMEFAEIEKDLLDNVKIIY